MSRWAANSNNHDAGATRSTGRARANSNHSTTGRPTTDRTPLVDSVGRSEAFVNKSVADVSTGVSWGVAAFLLVNTALGAGMLNYPYAYNQIGGLLSAALMQIVLLVIITSTMFILVYCADFNQDDTYHDVLLSMCGKRAQQISAISILLTCYGINITFLVIIGDQYDRIFESLLADYLDQFWFLDRKFTIFITAVLFIWPMCYAQRLDFLRHASILGMFAMLYVAFLTVYEHYKLGDQTMPPALVSAPPQPETAAVGNASTSHAHHHQMPPPPPKQHQLQWFQPLAIVPVLCFAYQTHEVIVPVYACMKQRQIRNFMKASVFGLVILFFLYNLVGAYGYLTFGPNVGADIMSLYDAKDPVVIVGIVALVIKFITTYPPLMFCGRGALDGLYGELRKLSTSEFKSTERARRIVITTLWFFSTVALAVFAPDISVTLQLLGSMASINVFVFPGMCLISLTRRLRRARLSMLLGEDSDNYSPQRARDFHVISGSHFGDMKRKQQRHRELLQQSQQSTATANGSSQAPSNQFAATFASLVELENSTTKARNYNGEHSGLLANGGTSSRPTTNGYGSTTNTTRNYQRRQEEFDRLLTNGSFSGHEHQLGSFGKSINDSCADYSDCGGEPARVGDSISGTIVTKAPSNNACGASCAFGAGSNSSRLVKHAPDCSGLVPCASCNAQNHSHNKDLSIDRLSVGFAANNNGQQTHHHHHHHHNHPNHNHNHQLRLLSQSCLQSSWYNRSTTGSILDRLGESIAPSTVAQIGISRCAAFGLYSFSAFLILFGAFIFVLELVNVFGFL